MRGKLSALLQEKSLLDNYDNAWKDIIKAHFASFLSFYFPDVGEEIDLTYPPEFLEKELQKLSPHNIGPGRLADLLVKVHHRSDVHQHIYTHVEVQGRKEPGFADRLFQYAYRIYDRFHSFPVTLVVLTDDDHSFHPSSFEISDAKRYMRVEFHTAKLLYLKEKIKTAENRDNPFAFITAAQLEMNALRRRREKRSDDVEERYACKKRLVLRLYRCGYGADYIRSLLLFLDWIVQLPKELEHKLIDEIAEETGGKVMPYITSWERIGMERGLEKGMERGKKEGEIKGRIEEKREVLTRLTTRKFDLTPQERAFIRKVEDVAKLDAAIDAVLFAENKEEIFKMLK